jgi:hypothetical protein
MSLFSNSSGIIVQGGNFYSAGGDVNIQNTRQLVIGASDTHLALDQGITPNRLLDWQESGEGSSWPGPVRSHANRVEGRRFMPYGVCCYTFNLLPLIMMFRR